MLPINIVLNEVDRLFSRVEDAVEEVPEIEVDRSSNQIELTFPDNSQALIHLHLSGQECEVWFAGKSGAFHFRFDGQVWVDTRSGSEFWSCISNCLTLHVGKEICLTNFFDEKN